MPGRPLPVPCSMPRRRTPPTRSGLPEQLARLRRLVQGRAPRPLAGGARDGRGLPGRARRNPCRRHAAPAPGHPRPRAQAGGDRGLLARPSGDPQRHARHRPRAWDGTVPGARVPPGAPFRRPRRQSPAPDAPPAARPLVRLGHTRACELDRADHVLPWPARSTWPWAYATSRKRRVRPEATGDPRRRRRPYGLTGRHQSALLPAAHHLRREGQLAHHDVLGALNARAQWRRGLHHHLGGHRLAVALGTLPAAYRVPLLPGRAPRLSSPCGKEELQNASAGATRLCAP